MSQEERAEKINRIKSMTEELTDRELKIIYAMMIRLDHRGK